MDPLSQAHWDLLGLIDQGLSLNKVCEIFTEKHAQQNLSDLISVAIKHGWIHDFTLEPEDGL